MSSTTGITVARAAQVTGKLEVRLMGCQDLLDEVPGRSRGGKDGGGGGGGASGGGGGFSSPGDGSGTSGPVTNEFFTRVGQKGPILIC